jgi:hypothetical protein
MPALGDPAALRRIWGEVKKEGRWWKNFRNGNNQAMGQFANNRLWGFKVNFLKYLQELSWFITPS